MNQFTPVQVQQPNETAAASASPAANAGGQQCRCVSWRFYVVIHDAYTDTGTAIAARSRHRYGGDRQPAQLYAMHVDSTTRLETR